MGKRAWHNLLLWFWVMGMVMFFSMGTVKAEETVGAELAPVTISDFKISSHTVKPGDKIKYSFTLTETGLKQFVEKYGEVNDIYDDEPSIYKFEITWESSKKQKIKHTFYWEGTSNINKQVKVSGNIPVMKGMQSGTWVMDKMEMYCSEESSFRILHKKKIGNIMVL